MRGTRLRLLNDYQRDFPLVPRPFAAMATTLGVREHQVIEMLDELQRSGVVSRVGPVFRPNVIGASTLAAMAVPEQELEAVARLVSARPEVNHNYAREHGLNLWFVATAATRAAVQRALTDIEQQSGLEVLALPMLEDYHIDLGFCLRPRGRRAAANHTRAHRVPSLSESEKALVQTVQGGLPMTTHPFEAVAACVGLSEREVIATVARYVHDGVIKRFGVVVRHHELGYNANAMVVWDLPDKDVRAVGERMAGVEGVTLCYRRRRAFPRWPYNLYCMIHGRDRASALERLAHVKQRAGVEHVLCEVLFSVRRYKQRGAIYVGAHNAAA